MKKLGHRTASKRKRRQLTCKFAEDANDLLRLNMSMRYKNRLVKRLLERYCVANGTLCYRQRKTGDVAAQVIPREDWLRHVTYYFDRAGIIDAIKASKRMMLPANTVLALWKEFMQVTLCIVSCVLRYNTMAYNAIQHNTTRHNTTQHKTTQHSTTQHNTTRYNTTQHNTTQHNTTQHNTTHHGMSRVFVCNTTQYNRRHMVAVSKGNGCAGAI